MAYASAEQLLERHGRVEIAELANHDEELIVSGELLELTVLSGNRSDYTASEQQAADNALQAINVALDDAQRKINSYLLNRYSLPLEQSVIDASDLSRINSTIARYYLMGFGATDDVKSRFHDAIAWLRDVSQGKASLGEQDATVAKVGTGTIACGKSRLYWDGY